MPENFPLFYSELSSVSLSRPRKWDWKKNGFYAPRGGGYALDLISDLIISRYLYLGITEMDIHLDADELFVSEQSGKRLFESYEVSNYIIALCSVYKRACRKRMPLLGVINALGYAFTPKIGNQDSVKLQGEILKTIWRSKAISEDILADCSGQIEELIPSDGRIEVKLNIVPLYEISGEQKLNYSSVSFMCNKTDFGFSFNFGVDLSKKDETGEN